MADPIIIDARGLLCPMPVLKLEKQLDRSKSGARIVLLTDDPVARVDVPVMCETHGHSYTTHADGNALKFKIVKR